MPPMIPATIDIALGIHAPAFGWTMNGSVLLVLALVLIPWVVLGIGTAAGLVERQGRPSETPRPAAMPLREAA